MVWDGREDEKAYLLLSCSSLLFKGTGKTSTAAFSLNWSTFIPAFKVVLGWVLKERRIFWVLPAQYSRNYFNVDICRPLFLFVMRLGNGDVSDTPEKMWLAKAGLDEITKLYFSHKNIPQLIPRELSMLPGKKQAVFICGKSNRFWNKKVFKWQTEKWPVTGKQGKLPPCLGFLMELLFLVNK